MAADWRAFLIGADDTYLRTNPEPGVFSPIQYAAHVRDIVGLYGDRVLLAIAENNPTVFSFMPAEEVWDSYNRLPVELLADDLEARARRMAAMFDDLRPSDWSRTVFRDGTKEERAEFTVLGLMAYSAHESYHHLLDAKGTLGA
ncbi:MAG: DinB family protein [Acidimicrobiaceae bacterium]|nr:DinB family protein [Acidimicrobiaceae bacterium]